MDRAERDAVGEIRIPQIGLVSPIFEVSWRLGEVDGQPVAEWNTIPYAVGHHQGTALPGEFGNCVLSGHSRVDQNQSINGVFRRLHELSRGARVEVVDSAGTSHRYTVQSVETLQELGASLEQRLSNASLMDPTDDRRVTLITCWPDWGYTHRLVVVATADLR
jgi:sortase A